MRLRYAGPDPSKSATKTAQAAMANLIGDPAPVVEAQPLTSTERVAMLLQRARQITNPTPNPLQRDFYTFLTAVVKTKDEARAGLVRPIEPHPYVKELCDYLVECRMGLIAKSRRVVASWITCAFDVWVVAGGQDPRWPQLMLSTQNRQVVIASRKLRELQSSTYFLRNRVRFIVDELEKNNIREQWPDFPEFEWVETEGRASNGGIISAIASGEHQARGVTGTFVHCEEIATWEEAKPTIETMKLVTLGGGHLIGITTPMARSYAHQIYTGTIQNPEALYNLNTMYDDLYSDDYEDADEGEVKEGPVSMGSMAEAETPRLIEEAHRKGRVLPRFTTADGWEILVIHHSAVPAYEIEAASAGMSPDAIQRELELSWAASGGKRVFADFGYDRHVATHALVYNPKQPLFVGLDFGLTPAAVFTQINAHGQWLVFPSLSPSDDASLGIYEFGELVADHLQTFYCSPHNMQLKQLRAVFYGDPAGQGPPARVGDSPKELSSCYDILRRGVEIVLGVDEDGEKRVIRKPGWGWHIRPGAVDIPTRLEAVRARLRTTLRDGLPSLVVDPRATVIIEAMLGQYHFKQYKDGSYDRHPAKNHASHCLSGETLVETNRGAIPIRDVTTEDMVLTRKGWRRVRKSWCSGIGPVVGVCFADGREVVATREHKFWTQRGWVQAGSLRYNDVCSEKPSFFKDSFLPVTQTPLVGRTGFTSDTAGEAKPYAFIKQFGKQLTARFLRGTRFITRMATRSTIRWRTWNVSRTLNTWQSMWSWGRIAVNDGRFTWRTSDLWQPSGTPLKKVGSGIDNMGWRRLLLLRKSFESTLVSGAEEPFNPMPSMVGRGFVAPNVGPLNDGHLELMTKIENVPDVEKSSSLIGILAPHSVQLGVVGITIFPGVRRVYDLEVEDAHEFYANGVLVHNSMDSLQYIATRIFSHVPDNEEPDEDERSIRHPFRSHAASRRDWV